MLPRRLGQQPPLLLARPPLPPSLPPGTPDFEGRHLFVGGEGGGMVLARSLACLLAAYLHEGHPDP